jgi:putative transposase
VSTRRGWIDQSASLAVSVQCSLSGVARSVVYAQWCSPQQAQEDEETLLLLKEIDAAYTRHPFYGSRRMVVYLRRLGHHVNRKRVRRLMSILGLAGMAPGPVTSRSHPQHPVYPYLLRGLPVTQPNQVWSTDITYIRLARGFVYLVAIIDWYSRKVLAWQLSNTLDSRFCVDCLQNALQQYGIPEIFNTDQGCQFTATAFTDVLTRHGIKISMDGRGRALDNIFVERLWRSVKYEDIYLKCYSNVPELMTGLTNYFLFYNTQRPHQALGYVTPDNIYQSGVGGGACVVDKFNSSANTESGQRRAAA